MKFAEFHAGQVIEAGPYDVSEAEVLLELDADGKREMQKTIEDLMCRPPKTPVATGTPSVLTSALAANPVGYNDTTAGANNVYDVTVQVSDCTNTDTQAIDRKSVV